MGGNSGTFANSHFAMHFMRWLIRIAFYSFSADAKQKAQLLILFQPLVKIPSSSLARLPKIKLRRVIASKFRLIFMPILQDVYDSHPFLSICLCCVNFIDVNEQSRAKSFADGFFLMQNFLHKKYSHRFSIALHHHHARTLHHQAHKLLFQVLLFAVFDSSKFIFNIRIFSFRFRFKIINRNMNDKVFRAKYIYE